VARSWRSRLRRVRGRTTGSPPGCAYLRPSVWAPPHAIRKPTPLLTLGIAPWESGAEQLWRSLHEHTAGVPLLEPDSAAGLGPDPVYRAGAFSASMKRTAWACNTPLVLALEEDHACSIPASTTASALSLQALYASWKSLFPLTTPRTL